MKLPHLGLAILVAAVWGVGVQLPQPAPSEPQEQEEKETAPPSLPRPTLRPAPGGPRASNIVDPRRLLGVRKVFILRLDNNLREKLIEALSQGELFSVVNKRPEADAILGGSCFEARRIRKVHTEVFLRDRVTGETIWQDVVRQPFNPPPLESAVNATVAEIIAHLRLDMREVSRKPPEGRQRP
jgi:hypothetical protein